jgi:hypothetical protein
LFLWIGIGMCPTVSVSAIVPSLHGAWKWHFCRKHFVSFSLTQLGIIRLLCFA